MPPLQHIIKKQVLEVTFQGETDAFAFKEQLSRWCLQALLPAIEKVFDEKSPEGKVIRAGKLLIDAGELPEDDWQQALCTKVVEQLASQLAAARVETLGEQENAANTVRYFLGAGVMPWHAKVQNKQQLQHLLEVALNQGAFLPELARECTQDPKKLARLVQQFEDAVLERIIFLSGIDELLLARVKAFVSALFDKMDVAVAARRPLLYQALLANAFLLLHSRGKDKFDLGIFMLLFKDLGQEQLVQADKTLHYGASEQQDKAKELIGQFIRDRQSKLIPLPKAQPDAGKNHLFSQEHFITNGGLVLLHPFLARLYENVGYTEKNKWQGSQAQQRALALSQYLVTGQEEYPEFDLLLNKILIAYPPEEGVAGDLILSEFEKQEAAQLLASVIKHWAALKNTSADGLRATFLQREAKVWFGESQCYLKVGPATADILLHKLPWGLSLVKTPWMNQLMHVEWL